MILQLVIPTPAFNQPMAIVGKESVAAGGISVMAWTKSNGLNQY